MLDFSALYNQRSKLNKFIQENDLKSIKSLLVESYMNLNYTDSVDGQTPLHKTCQTGNIAIAKLLIEYGACQNIQNNAGWFPMHLASYYGHMDIFFLLINLQVIQNLFFFPQPISCSRSLAWHRVAQPAIPIGSLNPPSPSRCQRRPCCRS